MLSRLPRHPCSRLVGAARCVRPSPAAAAASGSSALDGTPAAHQPSRASSSSVDAAATTGAAAAPSSLRGPPCFTLEASVGATNPLDLQLLATGAFGAEVHPDLPIATTWQGLYKQVASRLGGGTEARRAATAAAASRLAARAMADAADEAEAALSHVPGAKPVQHVATVGAQLRSVADAADAMCVAAGVTAAGAQRPHQEHAPHADALLVVSGSHPVRQLPLAAQLLPGTLQLLARGQQLKAAGVLPRELELWAVANPVLEVDASYTEQKVAAGAQVILTQPPLDWGAFERWLEDAQRRGVTSAARLLVGFPCLSSAANCGFWLALCNAGGNEQCKQLEQQFRAAEAAADRQRAGTDGSKTGGPGEFVQDWNRQLLARLQQTPGVSGLHVMPITGASKRLALQLAEEGGFAPAAWPHAAGSNTPAQSRQPH